MLRKTNFFILLFLGLLSVSGQFPGTPAIPLKETRNIFGGTGSEFNNSMVSTADGGYVLAGRTQSNDGDVSGNHGIADFWIVKFSSHGSIEWKKTFGGSDNDAVGNIIQTADGGYAVTGSTQSNDGDVSGNHGTATNDIWVIKLSSTGTLQWQKTFGGTNNDYGKVIIQTSDGGYILGGETNSINGDVTGFQGNFDFWVVKISSTGVLQWQKTLGGTGTEYLYSLIQTSEGGYIMTGQASSNNGDVSGNHGAVDLWVAKISSTGTLQWQKTFGGTNSEYGQVIIQTSDGGYTIAGYTQSNDGDVSGNHGGTDYWVIKLNSAGTLQWQKAFGGTGNDAGRSMIRTADGGYVVAGNTQSNDGDISGNHGSSDFWVLKLSSNGTLEWQKTLGGTSSDVAYAVIPGENGYIVSGTSTSNDGDVAGPTVGAGGFLILKLDTNGNNVRLYDDITP
ncbi:hypothetical protein SD427_03370 [Chryseobacterium sp. JJR-5R]|uniref:hypothetical protein n=1 Tax=Chryseobacterium sp. JJR-5R TaxID=3093923 RepID=UPI002A7476F4|nr:hypothetical protein [Chryseobacterium sp. JJR-5R]WPO83394.1 hypothetical protein SD427_03370 [Chryseobacterium sp. JJR-5R]